jgi:acetyl-CoA acetyltransferase
MDGGSGGEALTDGPPEAGFENIYGGSTHNTYGMCAMRHMYEYGTTSEQLAWIKVAASHHAQWNEHAFLKDVVTVEQVVNSRMIADPLHLLDCCVVTDGGGALVLASAERAADLPGADLPGSGHAVYLLGSGEASEAPLMSQMDDVGSFGAFRRASAEAFATAGVSHADIGHFMGYDAFAHLPLYMLEDAGFVGRGESGAFIAEGHTRKGGRLPMNTNGGGLSYTHTGMYGMFAIQEAVRQLRGQAAVPVPGVTISFVQGVGMFFGAAGSLVLSNRRP